MQLIGALAYTPNKRISCALNHCREVSYLTDQQMRRKKLILNLNLFIMLLNLRAVNVNLLLCFMSIC